MPAAQNQQRPRPVGSFQAFFTSFQDRPHRTTVQVKTLAGVNRIVESFRDNG